jgi:N-acetyl sugar amidotransferase
MDTSDPDITFDDQGVCNHCHKFEDVTRKDWFPNEEGAARLDALCDQIKAAGAGKRYDCILGLSGGVDSSYLALKIAGAGLRPLVIHVDAGWNTELAIWNIQALVEHCGYDLHTEVIDWNEMQDLQLAYLKSGVPNQDVPQDHIFFSSLYRFAVNNGIRYVLSGGNIATESVLPESWQASAMDAINLRAIHRKFGRRPLRRYKTVSFFQYYVEYPILRRMRVLRPLNYMPYVKAEAMRELQEKVGYKPYPYKHGESAFTRFFQNYYLPARFGYDKRRPHYSSLINSGQMTRDEALEALEKPLYEATELARDKAYVAKKLGISLDEFEAIILRPTADASQFPNWNSRYRLLKKVQAIAQRLLNRRISNYS